MARPRRHAGVRCTRWRFRRMVMDACDALPGEFRRAMQNVALVIQDRPADDGDFKTLGLYQGIPLTERGTGYTFAIPDKITIYRQPLLAICHNQHELQAEVLKTVWHEAAHFFGLGDDDLPY